MSSSEMHQIGYTPSTLFLKMPTNTGEIADFTAREVSNRVWQTLESLPAGAFHNPDIPVLIDDVVELENLLEAKCVHLMRILETQDGEDDDVLKDLELSINNERRDFIAKKWGTRIEETEHAA